MNMRKTCLCISSAVLLLACVCQGEDSPAPTTPSLFATHWSRKTIYRSPQKPGYTCWVGAWIMPDKSLMVTFKQAIGPVEGRPRSTEFFKQIGEDFTITHPTYDYPGLNLASVYLRSTDHGKTWVKAAEDTFSGPIDRINWGGSHVALLDGSILRAEDGSQMPFVLDVPRRIFFQRSHDLGKTWGPPEIPPEPKRPVEGKLGDLGDCISRVRRLRDGRLIATGVARPDPANRDVGDPVIMFSSDEAKTWIPQKFILPPGHRKPGVWNEWDCAELPNGDLFGVFRRNDPNTSKQVRWQGIFKKKGDNTWDLENYGPSVLKHSGHPELLATKEGVILHIASTGIHWTDDAGTNWHQLTSADGKPVPGTRYYPKSVQTEDGQIFVCSHAGSDNGYGDSDQSINMDIFSLTKR